MRGEKIRDVASRASRIRVGPALHLVEVGLRMTLLEWVSGWFRRTSPGPDREAALGQTQRWRLPQPVAGEYVSLYTYLEHRYASNVVLTFEQIEALLGFPLPEPARTDRGWWTGSALTLDRHADAWTVASRTALPNLLARTVAFERQP